MDGSNKRIRHLFPRSKCACFTTSPIIVLRGVAGKAKARPSLLPPDANLGSPLASNSLTFTLQVPVIDPFTLPYQPLDVPRRLDSNGVQ